MHDDFRIEVSTSLAELNGLRGYWEGHQWHPDSSFDHFQIIVDKRDEVLTPCIISLYNKDQLKCLLIGRIEQALLPIKIGYTNLFKPRIKSLTIHYGGILGEDSIHHCGILLAELVQFLKQGIADVVLFHFLPNDSNMFRQLLGLSFFMRDHCDNSNLHWRMTLPNSVEELYSNMNAHRRKALLRCSRVFEREYLGQINFRCITKVDDVYVLCRDAEKIARNTYQRSLGAGFVSNDETKARLTVAAQRGNLRGYLLHVNNEACAFAIGYYYSNVFFFDCTAYDSKYVKNEPGTVLLLKIIEDLCNNNIKTFDFGFGDAFYKQRFGDQQWVESSVYLFSPSLKGILLNGLYSASCFINETIKKMLNKLRAYDKIKKIMRSKLKSKHNSE